ncbi:sensor histidine kinase [Pseudolysinimonas sp.]|uniref:sensor histidine kinase n=1 Tax=Pseudolysinimonas sp. TaxID=2680009 RepID=UPI0037831E9F
MARRGLSVRLRTTLAATVVVGLALTAGSVLFIRLVEDALVAGVAETAERDAEATASLLGASGATLLPEVQDALQQLYTADGAFVASSEDADALTLPHVDAPTRALVDGDDHVLVSSRVEIDGTDYDLRVALPVDDALRAAATVSGLLLVAVPVLLVVIALLTWLIVGRALRPVETIRRQVDAIGPAELDRRVAEPGSDDELARLARTMNRMLARLDGAARAQRRFVSDASHELRSPLASIRQHAEVARAHPDRLGDGELAEVVLAEGARLQDLVEQLLLLTRLDEGGLALVRRPVDLDDIVLADARRVRDAGAATVDTSAVTAARVDGDERMLARLLRNLTDNATRHSNGHLAIGLVSRDGRIDLIVDDDGPGIPEAARAQVFERFVRLDEGRARDAGGSGLGLAIVAEIARAHGGSVRVEGSPLGGARFVVTLPAAS